MQSFLFLTPTSCRSASGLFSESANRSLVVIIQRNHVKLPIAVFMFLSYVPVIITCAIVNCNNVLSSSLIVIRRKYLNTIREITYIREKRNARTHKRSKKKSIRNPWAFFLLVNKQQMCLKRILDLSYWRMPLKCGLTKCEASLNNRATSFGFKRWWTIVTWNIIGKCTDLPTPPPLLLHSSLHPSKTTFLELR